MLTENSGRGCLPEYIAFVALEDAEGDRAVVVLERRDVIVAEGELGPGVDL